MGVYKRELKGCLRWRYGGSYKGEKYTSRAIYETAEEALKAEQRYLAKNRQDTLARLVEDRLGTLRATMANRGYYVDTRHKLEYVVEHLGPDTLVTEVTRRNAFELVQQLALEYQMEGLSVHPTNHFIRIAKAFFNWCIDERQIEMKNPFHKMKLLPLNDQKPKHIPTEGQVYKLREKLSPHQKALFRFVDESGCRIMEAVRLDMRDVREDTVTLWTRKAKNTDLTPRVIPRPESFEPAQKTGRPFDRWNHYPRFLGEKVAKLKQKPVWNWHNLRHRRASMWAKDGMTTFEIMNRLGHNNLSTTMIYLHQLGIYRA